MDGGIAGRGRLRALDGLRGLAALVVVVHHVVLTTPRFWAAYEDHGGRTPAELAWWLTHTPLHLFWSGDEAVLVFFVLSGLVLTRPVVRADGFPWLAYYVKRLPRLYLPVWGSLVVAGLLALAVTRDHEPHHTLIDLARNPTGGGTAHDVLLVFGVDGLNSPLWSLRWEVLFSLLLPLYVWVALALRKAGPVLFVGALAVATVGSATGRPMLVYLPVFALGVLIAAHWDRLADGAARLRTTAWWTLAVLAALCLTSRWYLGSGTVHVPTSLVGATLTVALFAWWAPAVRLGSSRVASVLGRLSFSLYLVHWPVIVTVGLLLGAGVNVILLLVLALVASLLVAEVFFRLVEGPSHRMSQRLGAWIDGRSRRARTAV